MGDQAATLRHDRLIFWGILALAVAVRIAAFDPYTAHHPDESIQYLEQAHRMVFGYGVVPWEFRESIRSWLIPLALAGPMQLGEWLAPGTTLYLALPRSLVALVNIAPVAAAWFIGARVSRQLAIVAMAVVALWAETVLFSVQTLSESMAVACFLPAAALLRTEARFKSIALAGFLMALAGLLRFQFAPAIAVYALAVAGRDWRMWKGLLLGGIPVAIGGAGIDLAMGLAPYEWIYNNYAINIGAGKMREIGGASQTSYGAEAWRYWSIGAAAIVPLSLLAGKQYRPLLLAAVANLLVHQLIAHKEWRYLYLSLQIVLLLAAIGSVNLARAKLFGRRLARPQSAPVTAGLVALWGAGSLALALSPAYRDGWRTNGAMARLAAQAARDPAVCGLAGPALRYTEYGYGFVHRPIPIHLLRGRQPPSIAEPGEAGVGFNAILAGSGMTPPPDYAAVACGGEGDARVCLYRRPGSCAPNAASVARKAQRVLLDVGL